MDAVKLFRDDNLVYRLCNGDNICLLLLHLHVSLCAESYASLTVCKIIILL